MRQPYFTLPPAGPPNSVAIHDTSNVTQRSAQEHLHAPTVLCCSFSLKRCAHLCITLQVCRSLESWDGRNSSAISACTQVQWPYEAFAHSLAALTLI